MTFSNSTIVKVGESSCLVSNLQFCSVFKVTVARNGAIKSPPNKRLNQSTHCAAEFASVFQCIVKAQYAPG